MSWWFSLILVVALLLLTADWLFGLGPDREPSRLTVVVSDQVSGARIQGATVAVAGEIELTNKDGKASFQRPGQQTVIQVLADGYQPAFGVIDADFGSRQPVSLRPLSIPAAQAPTAEPERVTMTPEVLPEEPDQAADVEPTATEAAEQPTATRTSDETADGVVAAGRILNVDGDPIYAAMVRAGDKYTRSKRDGTFALKNADVANGLVVTAPGYAKIEVAAGMDVTVNMERQFIKAAYLNASAAGSEQAVNDLIDLIDRTELNAVVIDIKEGFVFYDTSVQFFRDSGAVKPTYDPAALVKKFKDHGIYTIARQVVFNDPVVAEANHELAVQDEVTGDFWRGWDGGAWVNPFKTELWQPNIDLAVEAAGFGFDEIQYDYIRFPSDGDLTTADFGPDYSEEGRVAAIVEFLKETRKALAPTGAMFAVDVFGIIAIYPDDQGIGQRLADIVPVVDYVCPMIYPSHFDATSIDVGGEPNALPYETISLSVVLALQKMEGNELKLRPWLQDFSYGEPPYGPDEVRAQITATEEQVGSGWMLWNAGSEFTEGALNPE